MYQINIDIDFNAQKSFINIFAVINAIMLFIIAMIIPVVYGIVGEIEYLSPMPIITYVFMIFVRFFTMSQLVLACSAIRNRFKLFNEAFSRNILLTQLEPLSVQKSTLKHYGSIFHQLCDTIETINHSLTFQFIPLVPHILVRKSFPFDEK